MARTDDADYGLLVVHHLFDEFESLSPEQQHHAKTGAGIAREVIPANSKRALNKFLTEYDWDEQQFNHERLEELKKHGETRWSKNGHIIFDDTITEKTGDEVPGVGHFYDHAEGDTVWGHDLIAFYANNKTAYPLTFRLYEKQDEDDQDHDTKYDLVGDAAAITVEGTLFAGDDPRIVRIDGFRVDAIPHGRMVVARNADAPGVIGLIGSVMGEFGVNIAGMFNARETIGGEALTVYNVDSEVPDEAIGKLLDDERIGEIRCIELDGR